MNYGRANRKLWVVRVVLSVLVGWCCYEIGMTPIPVGCVSAPQPPAGPDWQIRQLPKAAQGPHNPKDRDGDGTPDSEDGCPRDWFKTMPGLCGCNVCEVDTDGDGTPDCVDPCPHNAAKTAPGIRGCDKYDMDLDYDGDVDMDDWDLVGPLGVDPVTAALIFVRECGQ